LRRRGVGTKGVGVMVLEVVETAEVEEVKGGVVVGKVDEEVGGCRL